MKTKFLVICSEFNKDISQSLLNGALGEFANADIPKDQVEVVWVPGSFEIPTAAGLAARSGKYQAIICLGAVIKGETYHFEVVADNCARLLADIGKETGVPTIFGVLTTHTLQQAYARSGIKGPNHGPSFVKAALQMAELVGTWKGAPQ